MASNELARLRADFLSIMESARGPRPISGGWYKAKKTPSGQHINGASHSIYRIHPHPPSLFRFQLISFQPRWLRNWTEDEPNSYHLLANHRGGGGGWSRHYTPRSDGFELHALQRSTYRNYSRLGISARVCVCRARFGLRILGFPTSGSTIQAITSFPGQEFWPSNDLWRDIFGWSSIFFIYFLGIFRLLYRRG